MENRRIEPLRYALAGGIGRTGQASWRMMLGIGSDVAVAGTELQSDVWARAPLERLRGQILDPSGAVVPEADVTITNQQTGVVRQE